MPSSSITRFEEDEMGPQKISTKNLKSSEMMKKFFYFIPLLIIFSLILAIFYWDKGLMTGTDNAFYLDEASQIFRQGKLFIDFTDYRIPVLPLIISTIYSFGFNDSINLYVMLVFVYSLYIFSIYFISLSITHSQYKALMVSIITFLSISARQFDIGRNMCVPLFYSTLELVSVLILLKLILIVGGEEIVNVGVLCHDLPVFNS